MKLTQEQLSSAMVSFGCVESQSLEDGRRRIRVPQGAKATIIPCGDSARGELTRVVLVNLSEGGIGILNGFPMRVGENFILRTTAGAAQAAMAILCTVIYCNDVSPQSFSVGAQFARMLALPTPGAASESFAKPDSTQLSDRDLARVREVEERLSRLST